MAWIGDRQDGMIQDNHLDTDRGIVKVAERKFPGQKLFNGLIWLIYNKRCVKMSAGRHISFLTGHLFP